jgi:hypothetical protein
MLAAIVSRLRPSSPWYATVLGCGVLAAMFVHRHTELAVREVRLREQQPSHQQALATAYRLQTAFRDTYQGLRTIARLPGIRAVDVGSGHLQPDARQAAREIYNNLASNLDISEV